MARRKTKTTKTAKRLERKTRQAKPKGATVIAVGFKSEDEIDGIPCGPVFQILAAADGPETFEPWGSSWQSKPTALRLARNLSVPFREL